MNSEARVVRRPVLLIHGGMAEVMDAQQFWHRPGVVTGLERLGFDVAAPDRNTTPRTWSAGAAEMATCINQPVAVVAASNGVSVGLRLALDHPDLVSKLVLLWPATARDAIVDATVPAAAKHLLSGDTVRGTTDVELRSVLVPVAVMAAEPENPFHQHHTVDEIVALVPGATRIPQGFTEPSRPDFSATLDQFIAVLANHL